MPCGPFSAPIEEVTKEEDCVWLKILLQVSIGAVEIDVRVSYCETRQRPRAAWVCVRIDKLGVSYEDDMVWSCF